MDGGKISVSQSLALASILIIRSSDELCRIWIWIRRLIPGKSGPSCWEQPKKTSSPSQGRIKREKRCSCRSNRSTNIRFKRIKPFAGSESEKLLLFAIGFGWFHTTRNSICCCLKSNQVTLGKTFTVHLYRLSSLLLWRNYSRQAQLYLKSSVGVILTLGFIFNI